MAPERGSVWAVQRLAEALQLLCQAYDLAPGSPIVLNLLAHHCLLRGDHDKVQLCTLPWVVVVCPSADPTAATHLIVRQMACAPAEAEAISIDCRWQLWRRQRSRRQTLSGCGRMRRRCLPGLRTPRTICAPHLRTTARCAVRTEGCRLLSWCEHGSGAMRVLDSATPCGYLDVQALAIDRRLPVAQFGLGQMTLLQGQGEIPNAISLLESALATAPAWADALTVCARH